MVAGLLLWMLLEEFRLNREIDAEAHMLRLRLAGITESRETRVAVLAWLLSRGDVSVCVKNRQLPEAMDPRLTVTPRETGDPREVENDIDCTDVRAGAELIVAMVEREGRG